jgi:hypothetical protein
MAVITSRQDLIDYCFRRLGAPVIEINVDLDQVEDKVDDAIQLYQEFHSDATKRIYLPYQIQEQDVANEWIPVDPAVIYVSKLFPIDSSFINSTNMFSFKYQFALSDFHQLPGMSGGMVYYDQMRQYLSMLDMKLNGTPQVNFSRRENRLYIFGDFADKDLVAGEWVVAEVYQIDDPELNSSVYNDMFIKDYTTALIKQQWGMNMSKFDGMQLPGGVTISGIRILEEANAEIEQLRDRMRSEQELPIDFFVG